MASYSKLLYHITYGTKWRENVFLPDRDKHLYSYLFGILKNNECLPLIINGNMDHLHILSYIPPKHAVSDIIQKLKNSSSNWIKRGDLYPVFSNWQKGFGAFSVSEYNKEVVYRYIQNQKQHHRKLSYEDELRALYRKHGIEFDERYLL